MGGLSGPGVRVVLVGTGHHPHGSILPDVRAVGTTLTDLAAALRQRCGLNPAHLCLVVDPAGPDVVDQAVRDAAAEATTLLVVYYVGHGVLDAAGELHLATTATENLTRAGAAAPYQQALPYRRVRDVVSDSQAGTVVVVLDCCFASRASAAVVTGSHDVFAMTAVRDSYLLTAASRNQAALAPPGARHTVFTGALLDLLDRGDPTGSPQLTLESVYRYLTRVLPAAGRPEPRRHAGGQAGDLLLADNRAYQPSHPRRHEGDDRTPVVADDVCPYRGLASYGRRDARFFFGRDQLITEVVAQLADRLDHPRPLMVVGASGAGKTSLLRAGVLPALADGIHQAAPGSWQWPQLVLVPGTDPLGRLAAVLAGPAGQPPDRLRATLAADPADPAGIRRHLYAALAATAPPGPHDQAEGIAARRVLLVVDQFEELFTPEVTDTDRQTFIRALVAAGTPTPATTDTSTSTSDGDWEGGLPPPAIVVVGVRADFYGRCADYPELLPALSGGQVVVGPMSREEFRQVIVGPAGRVGLALEDGLVETLLRDLGVPDPGLPNGGDGAPVRRPAGTLPLLSYTLLATWQHREGRLLTLAGYATTGGVDHAVARTAEQVYSSLDKPSQATARTLLLRLVTLGTEGGNDTRRCRSRAELVDDDPARARAVLDAFAADQVRLLTLDETSVEITHEALLHAWPTLRRWIDADRAGLLVTQRLLDDAHTWAAHNRDPDLLYRGSRLDLAREHTRQPSAAIPPVTRVFLDASIDAARRRARRSRIFSTVVVVLLLAALAAGSVAFVQWRRAVDQGHSTAAQGLVNLAGTLQATAPRTSLKLDLAAAAISSQAGAADHLSAALAESHLRATLTGHTDSVSAVALTGDGHTVLAGSVDHTAILWDVADPIHPARRATLTGHTDSVSAVALT
ncbi:caspase, EACC1-associated type, partial [Frankia sp. Cr2]|uniref:caspase, EACC1-associated type n=1 Tax=Frankia sp. Cr2 TaxID=3073932 RepID=UPI002AD52A33